MMGTMREHPKIVEADLDHGDHQAAVLELLAAYATDPGGLGASSATGVGGYVLPHLRDDPKVLTLLAMVESKAVGLAICFRSFSTEADAPLIIISDFFVQPEHRRHGIGKQLLTFIDELGLRLDCPLLNLKVQADNVHALRLYEAAGFVRAAAEEVMPGVICLQKMLT
jgi:GNAT superfamily N-acetyltransferase